MSVCAILRVWASIGHRQEARAGVFPAEVLIRKLLAIDRLAAGTLLEQDRSADSAQARQVAPRGLIEDLRCRG